MNKIRKHNLYHIQRAFDRKAGTHLVDPSAPVTYRRPLKPALLAAMLAALCLLLAAFTYPLFSPLSGDALTLSATYDGNGIVTIQVENSSNKKLEFQQQAKLIKWITGDEVERLSDNIIFEGTTIAPKSTGTLTIDLSNAYNMELLEKSWITEWYYLVLTNDNFAFGQEWKCSIYFGDQQVEVQDSDEPLYSMDPAVIAQMEEELRYYFEDDYIGIFAANPLHYDYLQKVHELLQRSGKQIVPSDVPMLMLEPLPDGVIFDETHPAETQYILASKDITVQDAFGKLVGASESEYISIINVLLPYSKGETQTFWKVPLFYLSTFEKSLIQSPEDCAFIHGQIVSFAELAEYKVYEDEQYVCYDVSHLFYSDLREYVEDIVAMNEAGNFSEYYDEQCWTRIVNVYEYYKDNLVLVSWEEYCENRVYCHIEDSQSAEELLATGLGGTVTSNRDIKKIDVVIYIWNTVQEVVKFEIIPDDPRSYDLSKAKEISQQIQSLPEGEYTLEIHAWLDCDAESFRNMFGQKFDIT